MPPPPLAAWQLILDRLSGPYVYEKTDMTVTHASGFTRKRSGIH